MLLTPQKNRTLSISVYRNPYYMDQYCIWDSHHHIVAKYSVINTLVYRAKVVCSIPELLRNEQQHLKCKYPAWVLDGMELKNFYQNRSNNNNNNDNTTNNTTNKNTEPSNESKGYIVISYPQDPHESTKDNCSKYGIQTHFKGNRTLKNIPVIQRIKIKYNKK